MSDDYKQLLDLIKKHPEHLEKFFEHYYKQDKSKLRLETKRFEENTKLANNAQFHAFLISILAIICGSFVAFYGAEIAGAVIGGSGLAVATLARITKMTKKVLKLTTSLRSASELN